MKHALPLLFLFLYLQPGFAQASTSSDKTEWVTDSTVTALKERRTLLRSWAPKCSDGSLTMSDCPFWDAVEYMGMLCLSGETEYCEQVKNSQDRETGRWFRSPEFKLHPDDREESGPSFSHDMDEGAWAYIIATEDREAALKYIEYIRTHDDHSCPKKKKGWDACATRLTFWTDVQEYYEFLGLPKDKKKMKGYKFLLQSLYLPIEVRTKKKNFALMLSAESIYTKQKLLEKGGKLRTPGLFDRMAQTIYKRDRENGFYEYLAMGPTESAAQKILKMCPSVKPEVAVDARGNSIYTEPANGPWEKGSGHFCIFMINALLGSAN